MIFATMAKNCAPGKQNEAKASINYGQGIKVEQCFEKLAGCRLYRYTSANPFFHNMRCPVARILVIDDSSFARLRVCHMLQDGGHETLEAENGKDGVAKVLESHPDCVVTDLLMPEMDGIGFLETLRQLQLTLPVIVLTADIQESKRLQCLDLGAAGFLGKPPQSRALLELIKQLLGAGEVKG